MVRVLITGANRGIGLELVRQSLARGDRVFAGYRDPARAGALEDLAGAHPDLLQLVRLDVSDEASIESAATSVGRLVDGLDVLVNNAGVGAESRDFGDVAATNELGHLRAEEMLRMFRVNAVGPMLVTQAFLGLLRNGERPRVVQVTSQMGSIARTGGGSYTYRGSKAALNMLNRVLSFDLTPLGIAAVVIHPGWVRTDMGGPDATVAVEESAAGLLRVIDGLTTADSGRFLDYTGAELPW